MSTPNPRQPVVIQISREAVERADCSREVAILNSFVPELCERNRNRVEFEVMGYQEDPREVYEVQEIRTYFQRFFAEYPGLFFWIDTETHMFRLLAVLLYPLVRVPGGVRISPENMQMYLLQGFRGLNDFCAKHGLDPNPSTSAVRASWMPKETER